MRSDLEGIMTEVVTVIVTEVSVIVNEEHGKQPVSPLVEGTCVTFQQRMVSDQLLAWL